MPSAATPIVATVLYTLTNTTGSVLDDEHLVFVSGNTLDAYPALTPDEFGIDVPGIVLVQTAACTGNPGGPCVFGAVTIPVLAPGAVFQFQIQHVLNDTLSGSTVIPTPGLALLQHTSGPAVPEPAPLALALSGLAGLAVLGRRARA